MQQVAVYYFKIYDINTTEILCQPQPATRDAIVSLGCTPIEETAQEVDSSQLDGNGFLRSEYISD
jgi:hypothetical protein